RGHAGRRGGVRLAGVRQGDLERAGGPRARRAGHRGRHGRQRGPRRARRRDPPDPAHRLDAPAAPGRHPAAAARVPDRAPPRAERRPAAQPGQDRHGGVRGEPRRPPPTPRDRPRPPGDRPARAGARAPPGAGRAAVHRRRARVRGDLGPPGAPPRGALLREGGGEQGAADGRAAPPGDRGRRRRRRAARDRAVRRGRRPRGGAGGARARVADPHADDGRGRRGARMSALPEWLAGLPDAEAMRATDRWAIDDRGIPGIDLMERAGEGLAALVRELEIGDEPIAVVCGKGNNGGDGYVVARLLREAGRTVRVLAIAPLDELEGDARTNAERLPGDPPEPFSAATLEPAALAVDALLGTGFSGVPRGPAAEAIDALNAWGGAVVACDVPSGVDASTGEVQGAAVQALATATFGAAKPGLWVNPGKAHAGAVRVVDIGIPPGAPVPPAPVGLIHDAALLALVPRRRAGWTKFTSGHVLVAGGARGLSGAPCLAAEAAQRTGAGYVTACVPAAIERIFEMRLLEAMTRGLPD